MELTRPAPPKALISLVPLVDVLLIMLVFFMVTSTYLDLEMIPTVAQAEEEAAVSAPDQDPSGTASATLLIRLAPDGRAWLRGRALSESDLRAALQAHATAAPDGSVHILAAPRAELQALVSLMDLATAAGVGRIEVLRTGAGEAGAGGGGP